MLGIAQLINEAWGYESANDHEVALRLYKTAFNNLLDINGQLSAPSINLVSSVSPFEIRTLADYVNYRSCHIHFTLNHPREAITQFKKYVDIFRQHTKSPEYAFEHAAWLSQQYLMFAELFDQAVTAGVKASKAQHPGYYYHEAAIQIIERRKKITEYTNDTIRSNQMPVTDEMLSMITISNFPLFLRQCGWICIDPNAAIPIEPLICPPYQDVIIKALYKAIKYFEEWNRPRIQNYISVLIADEYVLINDLPKAIMLYNRSLASYEKEQWIALAEQLREKITSIELNQQQTSHS